MWQRRSLVSPCVVLIISTSFVPTSLAAIPPEATYELNPQMMAMFHKKYPPLYPVSARAARMQGLGVFRMYIDENGVVTKVEVMKSTGHRILDMCASAGLRRWRAKPGQRREVDMPVRFVMR
jgi:TonB family protein